MEKFTGRVIDRCVLNAARLCNLANAFQYSGFWLFYALTFVLMSYLLMIQHVSSYELIDFNARGVLDSLLVFLVCSGELPPRVMGVTFHAIGITLHMLYMILCLENLQSVNEAR